MIKYDCKKVTVPTNVKKYRLTSAQIILKWTEIFALEPKKAALENMLSVYMKINGSYNIEAMEKAYNKVVELNDALRLIIFKKGITSYQYISDFEYEKLEVIDLGDGDDALEDFKKSMYFIIPWDNHKLIWAKIVKWKNSATLFVRMHHAVSDGYSMSIMIRQLNSFYDTYAAGGEVEESPDTSVVKFFEKEEKYKTSKMHEADFEFWKNSFHNQRKFSFPAGRRCELGTSKSINDTVCGEEYKKLKEFCTDTKCSMQSVMLAFMVLTTYTLSGKENFCIYSMTHGRNTPVLKKTMGCMMNTVPVFFDLDKKAKSKSIREFVGDTYINYLLHLSHGNLSMNEMTPLSYKEAIKNFFNFNPAWMIYSSLDIASAANIADKEINFLPSSYMSHQFYAAIMEIEGSCVDLGLNYQIHKYSEKKARGFLNSFIKTVNTVLENQDKTVGEILTLLR